MKTVLPVPPQRTRWSSTDWHSFLGTIFRPEHVPFFSPKIFRLSDDAQYVDCFFPIPCEHYYGGEKIIGRRAPTILPKALWHRIRDGLRRVMQKKLPVQIFAPLTLPNRPFHLIGIQLLPLYANEVLALVTDYHEDGTPIFPMEEWNPAVKRFRAKLWPGEDAGRDEPIEGLENPSSR